ncbi:hypothetical protein ACFSRY_11295 [Pontibacter locisalis]|uniref:PKD/Chitinase domain-containing protein n=1 Tax=Pontibacter locisalis TaxID=1719035 RepID=A0ABW5ILB1_9BACT
MKKRFHSLTMTVFIFLLILAACSKEDAVSPLQPSQPTVPPPTTPNPPPPSPPSPPPSPPVGHTAPVAQAGNDTTIYVPFSSYTLNGKASTGSIVSYRWKLIKGPSQQEVINYDTSDKPKTFVDRLVKVGVYEFELTVTDYYNLSSVDTVKVTVAEPKCATENKEVIIKDLKWTHPWYTQISISNVFSYLPANSYIKNFYIKRDGSNDWELVVPWDYNLTTNNGQHTWDHVEYFEYGIWVLAIYPGANTTDDTPDVKIEYCN